MWASWVEISPLLYQIERSLATNQIMQVCVFTSCPASSAKNSHLYCCAQFRNGIPIRVITCAACNPHGEGKMHVGENVSQHLPFGMLDVLMRLDPDMSLELDKRVNAAINLLLH